MYSFLPLDVARDAVAAQFDYSEPRDTTPPAPSARPRR